MHSKTHGYVVYGQAATLAYIKIETLARDLLCLATDPRRQYKISHSFVVMINLRLVYIQRSAVQSFCFLYFLYSRFLVRVI
jgi:hypothetical protein